MNPFMFVVKSVPLPRNKNYRSVRQALVHIWVFDNSIDDAQKRALDYIKSLDWNPLSVEHALSISSEQIPHLHKDEAVLYRKASLHGDEESAQRISRARVQQITDSSPRI